MENGIKAYQIKFWFHLHPVCKAKGSTSSSTVDVKLQSAALELEGVIINVLGIEVKIRKVK
jgi:hypothetical protein